MLYQFKIQLSHVDQNLYMPFDFRVAQHPSEALPYLLTRTLAYVLSYKEGLEFSPAGLGDPESPALKALGQHGAIDTWIEIGNPSTRKLHKACKAAKNVIVYTYKNPEVLIEELQTESVHRASEIQVFGFDPKFLSGLEQQLKKSNSWEVLYQQGFLDVGTSGATLSTEVQKFL